MRITKKESMTVKSEEQNLCFMLSNYYSGATLLAILLNNHKAISCNGETPPFENNNIDTLVCSCGSKLNDCEHFQNVGSDFMYPNTLKWDRSVFQTTPTISKVSIINKFLRQFSFAHKARDIIIKLYPVFIYRIKFFLNKQKAFFNKTNAHDGSKVYIDGTKSIRRAELFLKYSGNMKIIYLVRDGRGFCASYIRSEPSSKRTLERATQQWIDYIKFVDILIERHPEVDVLLVKYENLCKNTNATINQMCEFLNLPVDPDILDFKNKKYHILGNQMRGTFDGTIKESLSWKTQLNKSEIDMITNKMQKELKRFNYI